ncbi:MAG: hypothetical protein P8Y73_12760 [Desulfuromonadales bacterium]|jgi:hypothetical protein
MTRFTTQQRHFNAAQAGEANVFDIRGYQLFSQGEIGKAHHIAHAMFDAGDITHGHQRLGEFLSQNHGEGSDWVHLQFHMALFELELGEWQAACARFWKELLPTATNSLDALTDAPALLWRLGMTAPEAVVLPWHPLRRTAMTALSHGNSTFVQLHNLLAIAGAGDAVSIENCSPVVATPGEHRLISDFSKFCTAIARRRFGEAGKRLSALRPSLAQLDGSLAQLQLFDELERWIERKIQGQPAGMGYLNAA